ncbi:tetratricopeptide repeat protein [Actinoplanes sp. NPDC049802]|uniref:tetratricopeptide repeat protein n=1 Tax=Actinoplanes sp. NPDC049802 TaxID=3154742 RepID=UPI0033D029C1
MSAAARARALADVGRLEQAEAAVRTGLTETPADAELLGLLAGLQRLQGHYPGALVSAEAAVAAAPDMAVLHIEYAECLLLVSRLDDALAAAHEAARLRPDAPEPHRSVARCLMSRRDLAGAREAAGRAVGIAPNSVPDLMALAEAEHLAGNRDAARAAAARALAEDPGDADGRWMMALLDAERMRVRDAMRGLRGLAADQPDRYGAPALTWPIRGLLAGLRRGLLAGVPFTAFLAVIGQWWPPAELLGRGAAVVMVFVTVGLAVRVLIPAGRLPWICLGLLPARRRRAVVAGLITAVTFLPFLSWYAAGARWQALAGSFAALIVLLAAGVAEGTNGDLPD